MSLLRRDRLLIGLAPDRVAVIKLKDGHRSRPNAHAVRRCLDVGGTPWVGALEMLDYMLGKLPPKGGRATVVLSNEFIRYANVPWTPGVYTDKERLALATDCFRAVHGEVADSWRVILNAPRYGRGTLAAAVDDTLVSQMSELLTKHQWRLCSLRPHLSAAFDRWLPRLEASDGCFIVVEPGCVSALFRRGNDWASVDNRRFYRQSASNAVLTLKQCIDTDRLQGGEGAVALLAPSAVPDAQGTADRPLRRLSGLAGPWPDDPWRSMAWNAA